MLCVELPGQRRTRRRTLQYTFARAELIAALTLVDQFQAGGERGRGERGEGRGIADC